MQPVFEVTLTDLVFGGDALGRLSDGRAVFVPFGLPDELVRVRLTEQKGTFARGEIVEILQASPQRIAARCKHFGICGGCSYQNMSYADQLKIKRQVVVDQLKRLGGLDEFPVAAVVPSPQPWNYRNSIQFHVSEAGKLGFQRAGSNSFVEISECHLPTENINLLWPRLAFDAGTEIERVILREGAEDDMILGLESIQDVPPEFSVDFPISAVYLGPNSATVLSGEESVLMQIKGRAFQVSIESFFQVNLLQAEAMVDHVLALAGNLKKKTVLDAYCGVGLFSAFLAPAAKQLTGIEVSEPACRDYAVNMDEFSNVELYMGEVEIVLPALKQKPDLVVIDPPRAGLDARVVAALAEASPEQIIYVSCDPATLARDVKRLMQKGFELKSVTPFDQFPQTHHIETVSEFRIK